MWRDIIIGHAVESIVEENGKIWMVSIVNTVFTNVASCLCKPVGRKNLTEIMCLLLAFLVLFPLSCYQLTILCFLLN